MGVEPLTERYGSPIAGVFGCYAGRNDVDSVPRQILILDYPKFPEPLRGQIRVNVFGRRLLR